MPAPGDQHRGANHILNPFNETAPRTNNFNHNEASALQSKLAKQLGPEYISTRPGANGGKVAYIAADKVINLANEVFGFNGWSSSIQNVHVDFADESPSTGKVSVGISIVVRVTLRDGTFHEDIGYGQIENCKGKAAAFEKAKKEAATDALKRALRTFGNVLGNCLYDKDYLGRIKNVKVEKSKWSPANLHRHPDFTPRPPGLKKEPEPDKNNQVAKVPNMKPEHSLGSEFEDEFGGNLFDDVEIQDGHGDEVTLDSIAAADASSEPPYPERAISGPPQRNQQPPRIQSAPPQRPSSVIPNAQHPQTKPPQQMKPPPISNVGNQRAQLPAVPPVPQQQQAHQPPRPLPDIPKNGYDQASRPNQLGTSENPKSYNAQAQSFPDAQNKPPVLGTSTPQDAPVRFVTSRAAEALQKVDLQNGSMPSNIPSFNPHAESPSLRRTAGIDHNKSTRISRQELTSGNSNISPNSTPTSRASFVNPQADFTRKIGMPAVAPSPLANRTAYKPPTIAANKRGPESARPPLADVSNMRMDSDQTGSIDTKKPRLGSS